MKTVYVRLNAQEERAFTAYADLMGEPLSTLFKKLMEEEFEDELLEDGDAEADVDEKEWEKGDGDISADPGV